MLTARAWWFLLSVLLISGRWSAQAGPASHPRRHDVAVVVRLSVAAVRPPPARRAPTCAVEREVRDEKAVVATLWAGQTFEVRVRLTASDWLASPHLAALDHVPYAVEHLDGSMVAQGVLRPRRPLELCYRIRCGTAGLARFEGVARAGRRRAGLLLSRPFRPCRRRAAHLAGADRSDGTAGLEKATQSAHAAGHPSFRRAGSGSELLDLRDYLPGDPPKTIAWKVSARRDRLITKEFESEVPVRCTLFVDASSSVCVPALSGVGPRQTNYGKALDRLVDLAAGILQASASIRDLAGLCLFDEHGATSVRPDRGGGHLTKCLRMLADAAVRPPRQERADPNHLLPLAYSFARGVYPELLRPNVNSVPFGLTWLEGFSGYSRRLPLGMFELLSRWKTELVKLDLFELLHRRKNELRALCWWSSFWALMLPLFLIAARLLLRARLPDGLLSFAIFFCPLASMLVWGGTFLLFALDALVGKGKRRRDAWRKQLAALLSALRPGAGRSGRLAGR